MHRDLHDLHPLAYSSEHTRKEDNDGKCKTLQKMSGNQVIKPLCSVVDFDRQHKPVNTCSQRRKVIVYMK